MLKNLNLLIHTPDPTDATSLYRGWGPMNQLARDFEANGRTLTIGSEDKYCWPTIGKYHVAFMQRPYQDKHATMMRLFKDQGIPVWVDYDDYLFGLPTDNPCYNMYMEEDTQRNIAEILTRADVVTVTTKRMKELIQRPLRSGRVLNSNVHVIPNGPLDWFRKMQRPHDEKKTSFLWRGSATHQQDLFEMAQAILEFNEKHKPDITFLGYNPWFLTNNMGQNAKIAGHVPIDDFYGVITKLNPSAVIVPLHDSEFNRCKSSIAYVEGTVAGALTIAPDFEEWRRPGVITYQPGDADSFMQALEQFMKMPMEERTRYHKMAYDHVWNELSVTKANEKRRQILMALADDGDFPEGGEPQKSGEAMELQ